MMCQQAFSAAPQGTFAQRGAAHIKNGDDHEQQQTPLRPTIRDAENDDVTQVTEGSCSET